MNEMTMTGAILTITATLLACGCGMYIAHRLSKSGYTKNMDSLQRLNLSAKIGLPIAFALIVLVIIIARIIK